MEQYVTSYCKTLDPIYLEKLRKYKNELVEICRQEKKAKGKPRRFYAITDLVINHFTKTIPRYEYLSGTSGIYYMTNGTKKIYLIGDIHNTIGECTSDKEPIRVNDWIHNILDTSDVFIDFFLEIDENNPGFLSKAKYATNIQRDIEIIKWFGKRPDTLSKSIAEHYNCFKLNDKRCIYNNARIHFSDIRRYILEIYQNTRYKTDLTDDQLFEYLMSSPRIASQYNHVPEHIRDKIISFIKLVYNTPNDNPYYAWVMDLYLLLRLFRTFDKGSLPRTIDNSIIYTGHSHILYYIIFLESIGFTIKQEFSNTPITRNIKEILDEKIQFPNSNLQCINISKLSYPLFG